MIVFRLRRGKCGQSPLPVAYPSSQMNPATYTEEKSEEPKIIIISWCIVWRAVTGGVAKECVRGDMLCPAEGIKVR